MSRAKNLANFQTTITDGTTSVATSSITNGSARVWINFNGTGTIATRDSHGVSSLTDKGTGEYNVNFGNNMSDGNYAGLSTGDGTGVANVVCLNASSARSNTTAASGYGIATTKSAGNADLSVIYLAVHGNLA